MYRISLQVDSFSISPKRRRFTFVKDSYNPLVLRKHQLRCNTTPALVPEILKEASFFRYNMMHSIDCVACYKQRLDLGFVYLCLFLCDTSRLLRKDYWSGNGLYNREKRENPAGGAKL